MGRPPAFHWLGYVVPNVEMEEPLERVLNSKWTTLGLAFVALAALAVAVVAVNAARDLRDQWLAFQGDLDAVTAETADALRLAALQLDALAQGTFAFEVDVDEIIPLEASVPFQRELLIPVQTAIPIQQDIDTTIEVDGPLGLTVPVDVRVPINLTVPVDLEIPFTVDETIEVATTTRIQLTVPIEIDVSQTDLAPLVTSFSDDLAELAATIEAAG